jgi:hypothetical protein
VFCPEHGSICAMSGNATHSFSSALITSLVAKTVSSSWSLYQRRNAFSVTYKLSFCVLLRTTVSPQSSALITNVKFRLNTVWLGSFTRALTSLICTYATRTTRTRGNASPTIFFSIVFSLAIQISNTQYKKKKNLT